MKRLAIALVLLLPLAYSTLGYSVEQKEQTVYICTGPQSKVYHRTSDCKGLSKCSKEIKKIPLEKAKSMKRRACKLCY